MDIISILIGLPILLYSAILHEIAHGYVAERLGDPTARLAGRLTLDPRKHIDPYLSILLPLLMYVLPPHIAIGGAKPVPVDEFNLRDGRKDMAIVSLAGPLTNVSLAIIASLLSKLLFFFASGNALVGIIILFLSVVTDINIYLAIFNLLPIPPLDGSKIFALLLPRKEATIYLSFGSVGIFILLILLSFPIGGFSLQSFLTQLFVLAKHLLGTL